MNRYYQQLKWGLLWLINPELRELVLSICLIELFSFAEVISSNYLPMFFLIAREISASEGILHVRYTLVLLLAKLSRFEVPRLVVLCFASCFPSLKRYNLIMWQFCVVEPSWQTCLDSKLKRCARHTKKKPRKNVD